MGSKGGGGGSVGSGANAPHPQDLPDNGSNGLFMALMQFANPLMKGEDAEDMLRARLLGQQQPMQFGMAGGGQAPGGGFGIQDLDQQMMFMQALANPET